VTLISCGTQSNRSRGGVLTDLARLSFSNGTPAPGSFGYGLIDDVRVYDRAVKP
jgi:hypothetical protein